MTWNIINNETRKSKTRNNNYNLNIVNKKVTSDTEVATAFENFFTDIPVSTTKSLNSSPVAAESILRENLNISSQSLNCTSIMSLIGGGLRTYNEAFKNRLQISHLSFMSIKRKVFTILTKNGERRTLTDNSINISFGSCFNQWLDS
ncbi:hypothetical protein evm_005329 [Chilo suppressalis]|nr:hypothetical protein evm_005329 [Chilo suppressalis]